MSWWQILIIITATLVISAMFTFVARLSLIQTFGEHLYDRKFGSRVTEQTYAIDEKARRRVRWGTAIAFVIILACVNACVWNAIAMGIPLPW